MSIDDESGAGINSCENYLRNAFPDAEIVCNGAPAGTADNNGFALAGVESGECLAGWGTYADDPTTFNTFAQPFNQVGVTLMRVRDLPRSPPPSPPTSGTRAILPLSLVPIVSLLLT